MQKLVSSIIFLLLLAPIASALSIKAGVESYFTDDIPAVVIGESQNADDTLAAIVYQNEFGVKTTTKASAADQTKTLVVIGGPCANTAWNGLAADTCEGWDQPAGKAIIISTESNGHAIILIGGTTGKDTRAAAKYVMDNFGEAQFNKERVILDTEGLPLPKDTLKVYKEAGTVNTDKGESSASGPVIIEVPNDASGGTMDLADGLESYLKKSYPGATVTILEQDSVNIGLISDKIFIMMSEKPIVSVNTDAPAAYVVIAAGATIWLEAQGYDVQGENTINQLIQQDLEFQ